MTDSEIAVANIERELCKRDVCCYCGGRALGYHQIPTGPNDAYNWVHNPKGHPKVGSVAHPDGWFTIDAPNWQKARDRMVQICGSAWANQYDETDPPDLKTFPRGELKRYSAK